LDFNKGILISYIVFEPNIRFTLKINFYVRVDFIDHG